MKINKKVIIFYSSYCTLHLFLVIALCKCGHRKLVIKNVIDTDSLLVAIVALVIILLLQVELCTYTIVPWLI